MPRLESRQIQQVNLLAINSCASTSNGMGGRSLVRIFVTHSPRSPSFFSCTTVCCWSFASVHPAPCNRVAVWSSTPRRRRAAVVGLIRALPFFHSGSASSESSCSSAHCRSRYVGLENVLFNRHARLRTRHSLVRVIATKQFRRPRLGLTATTPTVTS